MQPSIVEERADQNCTSGQAYKSFTRIGSEVFGGAQTSTSLEPERWMPKLFRLCITEFQRGRMEKGKCKSSPSFHTGEEWDHDLISLSHVKIPFAWKKETKRGEKESKPLTMESKPMRMLEPKYNFHRKFSKKKSCIFLKLNQIEDPFLVPMEFLLNQNSKLLPFKYFLLITLLHGPSPKYLCVGTYKEGLSRKCAYLKDPSPPPSSA